MFIHGLDPSGPGWAGSEPKGGGGGGGWVPSELQQEESQSDDTEEHKHVDEEQHPPAAVQPVGHRPAAGRAESQTRGPGPGRKAPDAGADLLAQRKPAVNFAPFIFVGFFLGQRGRALVSLPHRTWRR